MESTRAVCLCLRQAQPSLARSPVARPYIQTLSNARHSLRTQHQSRRTITTSPPAHQAGIATAEKEAEVAEEAANNAPSEASPQPTQPQPAARDSQKGNLSALDDLMRSLAKPTPKMGPATQPPGLTPRQLGEKVKADEARRGIPPRPGTRKGRFDISRMNQPPSQQTPSTAPLRSLANNVFDPSREAGAVYVPADVSPPPFRIGPSLGRSVKMPHQNRDLPQAFRALEITCARNKVKADMHRQRFHERPGMKRKRLHSERWRSRFKADFAAVTRRVEELRRKGW